MTEPNALLHAARERMPSAHLANSHMSRDELAEAATAWLWANPPKGKRRPYALDGHAVGKYERGVVRWPSAHYRAALRAVLGVATDAELGFVSPRKAASPPVVVQRPELEAMLLATSDESSRFLSLAEMSNVGEMTIEQMRDDVQRLTVNYLKQPTLPLFTRARKLRDRAFDLLEGRQRPGQTSDLYVTAGWSLALLAWITIDLGHPELAEGHARAAWACAENSDHHGLRAWVRATQHTAAFWQDDYLRAADYAADGCRWASGSAATFLASAHALDLARAGDREAAHSALVTAYAAADSANTADDEMGGPFSCPRDRAGSLWSDTHLELGSAAEAMTLADEALARFGSAPEGQRNLGSERMVWLIKAKGLAAMGEFDGVAEALTPVLATPPEHRVRPLLSRIAEVADTASADEPKAPIVADIRDGVAEFTRGSAAPQLTA